jgi:ankyrin repeat protein
MHFAPSARLNDFLYHPSDFLRFFFVELAKKVDLREAKDAKGDTVLHFAARKGCVGIYRFLVEESGLDVNTVSKTGARCA